MNAWPSTLPPPDEGLEEEFYKPQTRTEFEANYPQVYPRASRGRRKWPLSWSLMENESDYQALEAFFDANQGCMFTWTHPLTSAVHTCVFSADSVKSKWRSAGGRTDVQCPIEEV
jgi:hypothetical protein